MPSGSGTPMSLRARTHEFMEVGRAGTWSYRFDIFVILLILASIAVAVLSTVETVAARHGWWMERFDIFATAVFAGEYLARLWSAPEHPLLRSVAPWRARLRVAATPIMVIDLLSILPLFIELATGANVAAVRVLRIARFYRLARYVPAIATIARVIAAEWRALMGCVAIFAGLILLSSVAMYLAEHEVQPKAFADVPSAMWWAIVTLSTVGYGDVTPLTAIGRVIAGLTMVAGIGFFALPVGIIASGFQQEIKQSDFIVSFAMVAKVPLFARLDVATLARLVRMLHARKLAQGAVVFHKDERADAMYFIASGEVEIELGSTKSVRLGEGDFFGEMALLKEDTRRSATVSVSKTAELLVLNAPDFRRLLAQNPDLHAAIGEIASQRQKDTAARLAAARRQAGTHQRAVRSPRSR